MTLNWPPKPKPKHHDWKMLWAKELTFMERENLRSWGHDVPEPPEDSRWTVDVDTVLPPQTTPTDRENLRSWGHDVSEPPPAEAKEEATINAPEPSEGSSCFGGSHGAACTQSDEHGGLCGQRARK